MARASQKQPLADSSNSHTNTPCTTRTSQHVLAYRHGYAATAMHVTTVYTWMLPAPSTVTHMALQAPRAADQKLGSVRPEACVPM